MVNAPPTPPPTTATELRDQSRSHSQAPLPNPPNHPSSSTSQAAAPANFPLLVDFAAKAQYRELVTKAEETDVLSNTNRSPSRLFTISPLVLTYLILDNIPPAQYALARLPDPLQPLPLTKALSGLVDATAERQYDKIYTRAEALFGLAAQTDFRDAKLASLITNLVTNFVESFRHRTFLLISKAYSSLPLSLAQVYLGLPADQIIGVARRNGWGYDESTQILEPEAIETSASVDDLTISSLAAFKFISNSVSELEA